jgi:hypothetical protein
MPFSYSLSQKPTLRALTTKNATTIPIKIKSLIEFTIGDGVSEG